MPSKNDKAVYPIQTQAGIKRDGTALDGNFYTDGLWCRFRNGRPKKIGGYREIINLSSVNVATGVPTTPVRALYPVMNSPQVMIHAFHGQGVTQIATDQNGSGGSCADRTPGGWVSGDYSWSAAVLWDATGGAQRLIAHASNDLLDITSDVNAAIYFGTGSASAALTVPATSPSVSGGICVLQPFVFAFGSNGLIANCDTNKPSDWAAGNANSANVASTKIVRGMALRGGSAAPAGIFWSLAELLRVTFVGGTQKWRYDTLSDQSSILAKRGTVEYDGVYYWPGIDRFLMYNGVMKEVPNALNQDFFFDNLNFAHRNKVWGMRVSRWGEIWWVFPKYPATECNWAVILNVRENTWYDTPLTRASGFPARELPLTLMSDSQSNTDSSGGVTGYRIYQHETGKDKVVNGQETAIESYFETSDIGFVSGGPGGQGTENPNANTRITRIEPDFKQQGEMTVVVRGSSYPQSSDVNDSAAVAFDPGMVDPAVCDVRDQRRLMRLKFSSNTQGGDYHMGKPLLHLEPGDERG